MPFLHFSGTANELNRFDFAVIFITGDVSEHAMHYALAKCAFKLCMDSEDFLLKFQKNDMVKYNTTRKSKKKNAKLFCKNKIQQHIYDNEYINFRTRIGNLYCCTLTKFIVRLR